MVLETRPEERIIGGEYVKTDQFQFVAEILEGYGMVIFPICGSTIIHPRVVMTAAHCLTYATGGMGIKGRLYIASAARNLKKSKLNLVNDGRCHPRWDRGSRANDIALLIISQSFMPSLNIVRLPKEGEIAEQKIFSKCQLVGWGPQVPRMRS